MRNEGAADDWLAQCMKRHPTPFLTTLSLTTSLAHSSSFNMTNVESFINNLVTILGKHHFETHKICNMDKTGVISV